MVPTSSVRSLDLIMHPNIVQLLSVTMTASNGLRQSPGEQLCIRVHGPHVNGRYAIMENIAAPGTATPMHFHAEDEIVYVLEGTVTLSIDGDVFNASVGSIVVIPAGAHHAWRNRSNAPIQMLTFFSPGGVEELYPKLAGLSLEELSTVVEPFGSGIVGPPIDE